MWLFIYRFCSISLIAGYFTGEVCGSSAFNFIYKEDIQCVMQATQLSTSPSKFPRAGSNSNLIHLCSGQCWKPWRATLRIDSSVRRASWFTCTRVVSLKEITTIKWSASRASTRSSGKAIESHHLSVRNASLMIMDSNEYRMGRIFRPRYRYREEEGKREISQLRKRLAQLSLIGPSPEVSLQENVGDLLLLVGHYFRVQSYHRSSIRKHLLVDYRKAWFFSSLIPPSYLNDTTDCSFHFPSLNTTGCSIHFSSLNKNRSLLFYTSGFIDSVTGRENAHLSTCDRRVVATLMQFAEWVC